MLLTKVKMIIRKWHMTEGMELTNKKYQNARRKGKLQIFGNNGSQKEYRKHEDQKTKQTRKWEEKQLYGHSSNKQEKSHERKGGCA